MEKNIYLKNIIVVNIIPITYTKNNKIPCSTLSNTKLVEF